MDKVTLSQAYISDGRLAADFNAKVGKYYIVEDDIKIPTNGVDFPPDSVLEFRGGSFYHSLLGKDAVKPPTLDPNPPVIASSPTVRLNGSTISSPIYCIFPRSVNVTGFNNSLIHADWFRDNTTSEGEEVYINRAINMAKGCPVTLEYRTYTLRGAIKFPTINQSASPAYTAHHTTQTLISPGILQLDKSIGQVDDFNKAAIEIDTHNVCLKINRVRAYTRINEDGKVEACCVGIRLLGDNYHLNIDVQDMDFLNKGFEIIPTYNAERYDAETKTGFGIQYCRITFQSIDAVYGFYIDVYSGLKWNDQGKLISYNWFNENRILGGQLSGTNGLYFVDRPDSLNSGSMQMDGLIFENIGFEGLTCVPLKISNVSSSKFLYLRMMESLPNDAPWIILKEVSFTDITLKGQLNPDRVKIEYFTGTGDKENKDKICRGITIKSWIQDDKWGWNGRFDRLSVLPLPQRTDIDFSESKSSLGSAPTQTMPTLTAYSSITPYNMAKTIVVKNQSVSDVFKAIYYIHQIFPERNQSVHDGEANWDTNFNVLPRTLNVIIEETGRQITLNVSGMRNFAPCVLDVYFYSYDNTKRLVLKSDNDEPDIIDISDNPSSFEKKNLVALTKTGLYRLTWDENWNLVVTKIDSYITFAGTNT